MTAFIDNAASTFTALATVIAENPFFSELRANDKETVLAAAAGVTDVVDRLYLALEFQTEMMHSDERTYRSSVSVYVSLESLTRYTERLTDEEGNEWTKFTPRLQVSWPSYGSDDVEVAQMRAAHIARAVDLVTILKSFLPGEVMALYRTKAEVEAARQEMAQRRLHAIVERLVCSAPEVKGLRVGGNEKRIVTGDWSEVPVGDYKVDHGPSPYTRSYAVSRLLGDRTYIRRTA